MNGKPIAEVSRKVSLTPASSGSCRSISATIRRFRAASNWPSLANPSQHFGILPLDQKLANLHHTHLRDALHDAEFHVEPASSRKEIPFDTALCTELTD